jgi:hypothetical protein
MNHLHILVELLGCELNNEWIYGRNDEDYAIRKLCYSENFWSKIRSRSDIKIPLKFKDRHKLRQENVCKGNVTKPVKYKVVPVLFSNSEPSHGCILGE